MESNASALPVSLEGAVKLTLMNALPNLATTELLASTFLKATDVSAPQDTLELTAKKNEQIAEMTLAPKEQCAKMNQDITTTLACVGVDTLDMIVTLL